MSNATPIVFIVDDDISVRESLEALIGTEGSRAECFEAAQDSLARPRVEKPRGVRIEFVFDPRLETLRRVQ
jgi:FixJ family two-component response regulator